MSLNRHLGTFSSGFAIPTGITTGKLPDWEQVVVLQWPEATPLYSVLFSMLKSENAKAPELRWQERSPMAMTDTTNDATLTAVLTGTPMTVDNVIRWKPGMQVYNTRTTERCEVTAVNYDTNVVTLGTRNLGSGLSAALGINDGDTWTLLQVGREEASSAIPAVTELPTIAENTVQFMSDTMEMTWMAEGRHVSTNMNKESDWEVEMRQKILEFKIRVEMTLFMNHYATVASSPSGNNIRRYTGGLDWFMRNSPTNYNFGGNVITRREFNKVLSAYKARNAITEAHIFARPEIIAEIEGVYSDHAMITLDKLPSGLKFNVKQFQLGNCKFTLHECQTLQWMNNSDIWVLDMSGNKTSERPIKIKYHQVGGGTEKTDGRIAWINDQQEPSYSAKKSQLVAGMGLVMKGYTFGRFMKISQVAWS
jgi:hypothetical protein